MDSALAFLQSLHGAQAYALLLGLLLLGGLGLPVNEDVLLLAAAALTLQGVLEPLPLIGVAWLGIVAADSLLYFWGWRFGSQLLRHRWLSRLVTAKRLEAMQNALRRYGPAYFVVVRFLPGLRTAPLLAAGCLKVPYRHLLLYDGSAALVELPLLVYGVRYLGGRWQELLGRAGRMQEFWLPALGLLLLAGAAIYWWRDTATARPAESTGNPPPHQNRE